MRLSVVRYSLAVVCRLITSTRSHASLSLRSVLHEKYSAKLASLTRLTSRLCMQKVEMIFSNNYCKVGYDSFSDMSSLYSWNEHYAGCSGLGRYVPTAFLSQNVNVSPLFYALNEYSIPETSLLSAVFNLFLLYILEMFFLD